MKRCRLTDSEKQQLTFIVGDFRSEARLSLASAARSKNPDAAAVFRGAANHCVKKANVLRKALLGLGLRGLGERVTLAQLEKEMGNKR